ncbi:LacI family transcriptional regulator [Aestuariivirga litoralis]|uniref:LacI family transcriptional regulator n=1 Tax=Aestuariivirga litoralis TaxID=2650924 RepID=UPI0018C68E37|nr:LacI family transcriptional regulator [Aestuariivirga litoralis]MBG1232180.1 LacI family DNA-binding transcriptional regulator [Aestuariivirga litoralis]
MSEKPDKRPTLKSLAEITGLGISTVSQALRNSPEISAETRKRVQLAAQQAGYRPNRAGVRLRTGKSNVITLVLNPQDGSSSEFTNQDNNSGFFANIVYGISEALAGTSYHLVVTPYSLSDPMAPIRYIVETNSADGVIISRTEPNDPRVRYMVENNMPFATHGRTQMGIEHAYFDFDNAAYAYEAVKLLSASGRKRLALFCPPPMLTYYLHTVQGFERGLAETGATGYSIGSVSSDSGLEGLRAAGFELAHRRDAPDGIICTSSSMVMPLIIGMRDGNKEIGRDFDLVAKPLSALIALTQPKVIGIDEDFRMAGGALGRMVMARIAGTEPIVLQMLDQPKTLRGNT